MLARFICGKRTITHPQFISFPAEAKAAEAAASASSATLPPTHVYMPQVSCLCQSGRYQPDVIADVSILALILCSKIDFMLKKRVEFKPRMIFHLDDRIISMLKNVFTAILKSVIELAAYGMSLLLHIMFFSLEFV